MIGDYEHFYLSDGEIIVYMSEWGKKTDKVLPETGGQYTGKDIGNEKLFEGDIVEWYEDYDDSFGYSKTANGYSVVVWDNENYCWSFKTDNEYTQPFNDWNWENCFIIGNIHDNPELLEGGDYKWNREKD